MFKHLRHKKIIIGLGIISILFFIAIFAPYIAPHDPLEVDITNKLRPPSKEYLLGTDNLGRCIISRLIYGTRNSLYYSLSVLIISLSVGIPIGIISGYIGGKTDAVIMRIIDMFLALPSFMVALAISGVLGASSQNMVLAMSLVWWSSYARFARTLSQQIKQSNYIMAAIAGGCSHSQIIFRHILKNMMPEIIVLATLELGSIILSITTFSFIGLGVQPPTPEWGIMLSDSKASIQSYPNLMIYPALAIIVTVMSFNILGRGLKHELQKSR